MRRKLKLIIIYMMVVFLLVSCKGQEVPPETNDEAGKVEDRVEKELDLEDILKLTLDRDYDKGNYRLEYRNEYHLEGEEIDLGDGQVESIDINEQETICHYQDGEGRFKTILKRDRGDSLEEKIVTYNKENYILYDSDLDDSSSGIDLVWDRLRRGDDLDHIGGLFITASKKEFEDIVESSGVELPRNPLGDAKDLLEIYNHPDIYNIERLEEKEDGEDYVINIFSREENLDILFSIDREDFYIKSYSGVNGDAIFSGRVLDKEKEVNYDEGFFDIATSI